MDQRQMLEEVLAIVNGDSTEWSDTMRSLLLSKGIAPDDNPWENFLQVTADFDYRRECLSALVEGKKIGSVCVAEHGLLGAVPERFAAKLNVTGYDRALIPALEWAMLLPTTVIVKAPPAYWGELAQAKAWASLKPYPFRVMLWVPYEESWVDLMGVPRQEYERLVWGFASYINSPAGAELRSDECMTDRFSRLVQSGFFEGIPGKTLYFPFMTFRSQRDAILQLDHVEMFDESDFSLEKADLWQMMSSGNVPRFRDVRTEGKNLDEVAEELLLAIESLQAETEDPRAWIKNSFAASGLGNICPADPKQASIFFSDNREQKLELLKAVLRATGVSPRYCLEEELDSAESEFGYPAEYEVSGWMTPRYGFIPNLTAFFATDGCGCYLADVMSAETPEMIGLDADQLREVTQSASFTINLIKGRYDFGPIELDMIRSIRLRKSVGHDLNVRRGGHSSAVVALGHKGLESLFNYEFIGCASSDSDIAFYRNVCRKVAQKGAVFYSSVFSYVGQEIDHGRKLKFKMIAPYSFFREVMNRSGKLNEATDKYIAELIS